MALDYLSIPGKFDMVNTISIIKYFSFSYIDRCRASVLPRPSTFTFHKESSVAGIHPRLPLSGIMGLPLVYMSDLVAAVNAKKRRCVVSDADLVVVDDSE